MSSNVRTDEQRLDTRWLFVALTPPVGFIGWLWSTGAFEQAGCALNTGLLTLLAGS